MNGSNITNDILARGRTQIEDMAKNQYPAKSKITSYQTKHDNIKNIM